MEDVVIGPLTPHQDRMIAWAEFYLGVEFEAAAAARDGRELAWSYSSGAVVAVVDEAGVWAYAVAKEGR